MLIGALLEALVTVSVELGIAYMRNAPSSERLEELDQRLVEPEIIQILLQTGKMDQARQQYRKQTKAGRREAHAAIEGLQSILQIDPRAVQSIKERSYAFSEIVNQLRQGNTVKANKIYRQQTKSTLREAKEAIDKLIPAVRVWQQRERCQLWLGRVEHVYKGEQVNLAAYFADWPPYEVNVGALFEEDLEEIKRLSRSGQKLLAIKKYRQLTGAGLKEAKAQVENMAREQRDRPDLGTYEGEIQRLLRAGKKIEAIKYYRQTTGAGLKEAKAVIDNQAGIKKNNEQTPTGFIDPDELQRLLREKKKIEAIKYYRESTGVGLREAKDAVDWLESHISQE